MVPGSDVAAPAMDAQVPVPDPLCMKKRDNVAWQAVSVAQVTMQSMAPD